jgi:hypothetical protein
MLAIRTNHFEFSREITTNSRDSRKGHLPVVLIILIMRGRQGKILPLSEG